MTTEGFLSRLKGVRASASGWTACCPAHDDRNASLSVSEGRAGTVLVKCHAGCTIERVVAAVGLELRDLFPNGNGRPGPRRSLGRMVATYDYRDESGGLLFQVCRFEPKTFLQRHPDPTAPGRWIWNTDDVLRVPFRLPELKQAVSEGRTVFVTEGEKDCLAMVNAGFAATCNPGGAGKWLAAYASHFCSAEVIVIADKDPPGRRHAESVAAALLGTATNVRIIEVPDVDSHACKDAADYFAAGGEAADLDELARATPVWTAPAAPAVEVQVTAAVGPGESEIQGELWRISNSDISAGQKLTDQANCVVSWLERQGRFYFHPEFKDFKTAVYFHKPSKQLLRILSDRFLSQLSLWVGVNRAAKLFDFILSAVQNASLSGPRTSGVLPEAYWASRPGAVYLSSGDQQLVRATAQGIALLDNGTDDVLFAAGRTLEPWKLVEPQDPFENCALFADAHTIDPAMSELVRLWTYSLPTDPKCKPPLCLTGEVGSGKTRLVRGICELYGLPFVAAKAQDDGEDDFWTNANLGGIYVLDNVDTVCRWLADTLAAAATNGCCQRRRLYTDSEVIKHYSRAWLALTSANPFFGADPGLADRLLVVRMARRRGETSDSALSEQILHHRDAALSHIVATLRTALADQLPTASQLNARHPDFAALGVRIGRALEREKQAVAALRSAEADKSRFCLENDSVGSALLQFLRTGEFAGTVAVLAERLIEVDPDMVKGLTPKKLGKRISKLWPHLCKICGTASREHVEGGAWVHLRLNPDVLTFGPPVS